MLHEDTARHGEPVFSRSSESRTTIEDIVTRLESWDDQQPPFAIMKEAAAEIKQLRAAIEACNDDFFSLKDMYDRLRESRDRWQELAESLEKTN